MTDKADTVEHTWESMLPIGIDDLRVIEHKLLDKLAHIEHDRLVVIANILRLQKQVKDSSGNPG